MAVHPCNSSTQAADVTARIRPFLRKNKNPKQNKKTKEEFVQTPITEVCGRSVRAGWRGCREDLECWSADFKSLMYQLITVQSCVRTHTRALFSVFFDCSYFFEAGSLTELTDCARLAGQWAPGSRLSPAAHTEVTDTHHTTQLWSGHRGSGLKSPCNLLAEVILLAFYLFILNKAIGHHRYTCSYFKENLWPSTFSQIK